MPPQARGLSKNLIPTSTKRPPTQTTSHAAYSMQVSRPTGCTPPPAPRLRPVPLPDLESWNESNSSSRSIFSHHPGTLIARHQPTTLHRLLASEPAHASITYDISTSPVSLRLPFPRLLQAATWPACASMHITCEGLPWPINIEIPASDGSALTCLTVLCGIFSSLQRPVSGLEWQVTTPTMQAVAWDAFVRRCHANPSRAGQRLKRLDFLSRRTSFKGLSLSPDGWVMHVVPR